MGRNNEPSRVPLSFVKKDAPSPSKEATLSQASAPDGENPSRVPLSFVKSDAPSSEAREPRPDELETERERLRREYEATLATERERLRREHEAKLTSELERLREEREAAERERLRREREATLAAERERLQRECEATLTAERERLRKERETALAAERERLRKESEPSASQTSPTKFKAKKKWAWATGFAATLLTFGLRRDWNKGPATAKAGVSAENRDVAWDAAPKAGTRKALTVNGVEYAFRYCPAGAFWMGDREHKNYNATPVHKVWLNRGFWTLETEVTQEMWRTVMEYNPSYFSASGYGAEKVAGLDTSRFPVENISWMDAQEFIGKLNAEGFAPAGFEFRLPTEAEWEYACRTRRRWKSYFWGWSLNGDKANCNGTWPYGTSTEGAYLERTTAVGSYDANAWGLYDMHGNVWEWCSDWYGAYGSVPPMVPQTDPTGPESGSNRVLRGGGWYNSARRCRSACRKPNDPTRRDNGYGFRLVLGRKH